MDNENLLEGIKLYSIKELKEIEGSYYAKVKNSNKYIPVKIQDWQNLYEFRKGRAKKDYSIKYIRIEDIEKYLSKRISIKFE